MLDLNEVLSIRAQEYLPVPVWVNAYAHLNEVLSIRAQEYGYGFPAGNIREHLNEVLSIRAQEWIGSPNHYNGRNGPQ